MTKKISYSLVELCNDNNVISSLKFQHIHILYSQYNAHDNVVIKQYEIIININKEQSIAILK